MSAQDFVAALAALDSAASNERLHKLVAHIEEAVANPDLPTIAEAYLEAFCDGNSPLIRRRWAGMALCKMMELSTNVVKHLKCLTEGFTRIGGVILGGTEAEETKIVAGLIIREGLAQGIKFLSFWPNDKVQSSAALFPKDASPRWMIDFQGFLDGLEKLIITNPIVDPAVYYAVSLMASDGYRWRQLDDVVPLLVLQGGLITVILPHTTLGNVEFVDIPLHHIQSVHRRRSKLHDSQGRQIQLEPWDVVLKLKANSWTYHVNSSARSGLDFTILFPSEKDATDCENCIQELLHRIMPGKMISSPVLDLGQVPLSEKEETGRNAEHAPRRSSRRPSGAKTSTRSLPTQHLSSSRAIVSHTAEAQPSKATPLVTKGRKPAASLNGTSITSKKYRKTSMRPQPVGPKPKQTPNMLGLNDAEEEKGSISFQVQSSERKIAQTSLSLSFGYRNKIAKEKTESSITTSQSSVLPKILKSRETQAKPAIIEMDVFAIPQEVESRPRTRWRTARSVTYKGETSSEEPSGSEYTEKKRIRSSAKRPQLSKAPKSRKAIALLDPKGKAVEKTSKPSKGETHPVFPQKPSLLQGLLSKSQPAPSTDSKIPKVLHVPGHKEKENITPLDKAPRPESSNAADFKGLSSEIHILEKLNDVDSHDNDGFVINESLTHEDDVLPRKRPMDSSPPTTPSVKRVKMEQTLTAAPVRVLTDPSSPCGRQKQLSSTRVMAKPANSMQAPNKPIGHSNMPSASHQRTIQSRTRPERRHTPIHPRMKRDDSGGSANLELLSSNSKPTPASPHAESTAISGHADRRRVSMEREMGEYEIGRNDPFVQRSSHQKASAFLQRLTGGQASSKGEKSRESVAHIHSGVVQPPNTIASLEIQELDVLMDDSMPAGPQQFIKDTRAMAAECIEMDGETLAEHDEEEQLSNDKVSPIYWRSSPPPGGSPSTHSSTSAELEPRSDPTIPTSDAEEVEWENSLQPHQRNLQEQLLHVSKRVMRHIVDNETAVEDIADTYARDGKHLLFTLADRHNDEVVTVLKDMESKKRKMRKASEQLLQNLTLERKEALDG